MKRLETRLKAKEGWKSPGGMDSGRTQHYFRQCRSLCGREVYLGADLGKRRAQNHCLVCERALARLRQRRRT